MTNAASIILSSSSSSDSPPSFLPFHTRSIDCSLSVCLSLFQMTTSGSHLASLLLQTKPNQNPDKTKNGSSGHKSHMQILCGNATAFHQPRNVSSHSPLSLQRSSATKPTRQTLFHKFRFRCDEIVRILQLITIANSADNTNWIVGSTQPIYTFEELFKDMQKGVTRIRSEESTGNPNNLNSEAKGKECRRNGHSWRGYPHATSIHQLFPVLLGGIRVIYHWWFWNKWVRSRVFIWYAYIDSAYYYLDNNKLFYYLNMNILYSY